MTRRARVLNGPVCGYGRGWVAQYWDAEARAWFDLGDPLPTASDAQRRANAWMRGEEW